MLVYHHTDPPSSTATPDSVRAVLEADLAAVGDYPALTRNVAVANGSGSGAGQGFNAGDQIIRYDYNIVIVRILGNVWAVPDGGSAKIFDGRIYVFLSTDQSLQVTVSGTRPYDNAPGGSRATMTQMDTTAAPYGDIVALHPSHCFIPTVSALDVATTDLFYDIGGDPDLLSHTPFDAVYFPVANLEHVTVTPEIKAWLLQEIGWMPLAVGPGPAPDGATLAPPAPNPLSARTVLRFRLPRASHARLAIHAVDGREVARLVDGALPAGDHFARWEAREAAGGGVAPGVYFARLEVEGRALARKLAVLR
jgi:hypothetical protein